MLGYVFTFAGGLFVGAGLILAWAFISAAREDKRSKVENLKKHDAAMTPPPPPAPTPESTVKERLRKAVELTQKQQKLDTRASDENHIQYNEFELEKLLILKSILNDGFDPPITIRYNTGDQEQLLSTYVANIQKSLN